MALMSEYGKLPYDLGVHEMHLPEHMSYLYLPVRMNEHFYKTRDEQRRAHAAKQLGSPIPAIRLPENLEVLRPIISAVSNLYAKEDDYVYVTAKRGYGVQSRPGWHSDGFGTDDINVIWSKGLPTVFSEVPLPAGSVPDGHAEAMALFDQRAGGAEVEYTDQSLLVMDQYVIHRAPDEGLKPLPRQFVKISISKHRFNLEGNSHNYLFDYAWKMYDRAEVRNMEHKEERDYVDPRW